MSTMSFPRLETDRLLLSPITEDDIDSIYEIYSSESIMKYFGCYPISNVNEAIELIKRFQNLIENNQGMRWGIRLKSDNKLIGTCGFMNWNKTHARAEIGYELLEYYQKQGLMKEALMAIINYGYDILNLNRIQALVYPENITSTALLIRLGFVHEGLLRQYAFFRNEYQDLNMYSLLKNNNL